MPKPIDWKSGEWHGRKPGPYRWYEIQDSIDYHYEFEKHKIIIPAIIQSASYAFDTDGFYSNDKTSIIVTDDLYLLGILNSKIPDFVMHLTASTKQGGYFEYKPMYISQLPIRPINFFDPHRKSPARPNGLPGGAHAGAARQYLWVLVQSAPAPPRRSRSCCGREIEATDAQIDRLVYELYGLTEQEIKIVEGG